MSRIGAEPEYSSGKYAKTSRTSGGERNLMYMNDKQRLAYWEATKQTENMEANEKLLNADTKRCSRCGQMKAVENFGRHPKSKDGYLAECKACRSGKEATPVHSVDNDVKEMINAMPKAPRIDSGTGGFTDKALAEELRKRGYEVRATKMIEI